MTMRFLGAAAALAIAFSSGIAFADDAPAPAPASAPTPEFTITGAAAVVSQYRFRGLASSDNKPAVQPAFTVTDKSGFYISFWGSSGAGDRDDGNGNGNGNGNFYISPNNGTEIDVYGGYSHDLGKSGVTIDGGLYGYIYPSRTANNLYEVYGDLAKTYGPLSLKVGLNWAPKQHYFDQFGGAITRYNIYVYGNVGYIPTRMPALTLHGELGHTGGGLDYIKQYLDYDAGVSYKWKSLTFDISAVGTNITHPDVRNYVGPFSVGDGEEEGVAFYNNTVNSFYRVSKLVPVASITASF